MFNDEERKHIMDYEEKQMMDLNTKEMVQRHVHVYNTEIDVADDHQHVLLGISGLAEMIGRSHVHPIHTRTSFTYDHWHWIEIMTDRVMAMPDGKHAHYFAGHTSMNDGHCHTFADITNLSADMCLDDEEDAIPVPKSCKYKYKRPDDEEFN